MSLIFAAAVLSNQLWFNASHINHQYTVIPMVNLENRCEYTLSVELIHKGKRGTSLSRPQKDIVIQAEEPLALGNMQVDIVPGDWIQIMVKLSNGNDIDMQERWVLPFKPLELDDKNNTL